MRRLALISQITVKQFLVGIYFCLSVQTALADVEFEWPVYPASITQDYGCVGCTFADLLHTGIDLVPAVGGSSRVNATATGSVFRTYSGCVTAGQSGSCAFAAETSCGQGFGNHVVLSHADGLYSIYAHLNSITDSLTQGDPVTLGNEIGQMGNTGSTGEPPATHLHFQVMDRPPSSSGDFDACSNPPPPTELGMGDGYTVTFPATNCNDEYPSTEGVCLDPKMFFQMNQVRTGLVSAKVFESIPPSPEDPESTNELLPEQEYVSQASYDDEVHLWDHISVSTELEPSIDTPNNPGAVQTAYGWVADLSIAPSPQRQKIRVDGNTLSGGPLRVRAGAGVNEIELTKIWGGQTFVWAGSAEPSIDPECSTQWYQIFVPEASADGIGWACGDYLLTGPPGFPSTPVPVSGASLVDQPQVLSWQATDHAEAYDIFLDGYPSGTVYRNEWRLNATLTPGTHYWQVIARNLNGSTAGPLWNFTIANSCTLPTSASRGISSPLVDCGPALTISKFGGGEGVVTSNPPGINCGVDCFEAFDNGSIVSLTANPGPSSIFSAWSGDPDCLDGAVTINANITCTATFSSQSGSGPIDLSMTAAPEPVRPGEVLTYTMTVTNPGALDLTGVELRQILPAYIDSFSESGSGGDCPSTTCTAGEAIVFSLGTVQAGESHTIVLGVEVSDGSYAPPDNAILHSSAAVTEGDGSSATASVDVLSHSSPGLSLGYSEDIDPVVPGGLVAYQLAYGNSSTVTLADGVLQATIPAGASFVSASDGGVLSGGQVIWDLGTLSISESGYRTLMLEAWSGLQNGDFLTSTAVVSAGTGLYSAKATVVTGVQIPPKIGLSMTAAPEPVRPGEVLTYTMTVTNPGALDLTGVELRQILPAYIDSFSESGSGGDCPSTTCTAGEAIVFSLGTVQAGESHTIVLGVEVSDGSYAPPDNAILHSSAAVTEGDGSSATASVDVLSHSSPGLSLGYSEDIDPVVPGGLVAYQLAYGNSSTVTLADGVLQATIPAGASFVSASDGGVLSGGQVIWDLGTLSISESGYRTLMLEAWSGLQNGDFLTSTAVVSAGTGLYSAKATVVTGVQIPPKIGLSMTAAPEPVRPGEILTYTMTVTNPGALDLTGVELRQILPAYIDSFLESASGGDCPSTSCSAGEAIVFSLGTLQAGESHTIVLGVEVSDGSYAPPDNAILHSSAAVTEGDGSSATASVDVLSHSSPGLSLGYSEDIDPVVPGGLVAYQLAYGNSSTVTLADGVLQATIPAGASFVSASDGGVLSGGQVIWDLGTLSISESGYRTLMLEAWSGLQNGDFLTSTAVVSAGTGLYSAKATVVTGVQIPPKIGLSMTAAPEPVRPGEILTYTMTVTNPGALDLTGVELRQILPAYIDSFLESASGGDCPSTSCSAGEAILFSLGTLQAGESHTIVLGVEVSDGSYAPPDNAILHSSAAVTEGDGSSATASVDVLSHSSPGLSLGYSEDIDPVVPGGLVAYQLAYGNSSTVTLADGVLQATIPAGASFVSASDGGVLSGGQVIWDLGTLSISESGYRTLMLEAWSGLQNGDFLTSTAVVSAGTGLYSAKATVVTGVQIPPKIGLSMTAAPEPVRPGEILTYTMTVTNPGALDLTGVELRQILPAYIDSFLESASGGDCPSTSCSAGEAIVFSLGTLQAGESHTIVLGVEVSDGSYAPPDNAILHSSAAVTEGDGSSATASANIIVDSGIHSPTCSLPDHLEVSNEVILAPTVYRACVSVTAGPSVEVQSILTLQAGNTVILSSGFSVENGAELTVIIEPPL